jgi:serine/threonine protein kinase
MVAERHEAIAPELRYEVLGTIARGGMAEIQLARARGIEGFETLVAIKRILPHLAKNREFVEMFLDEARIAATLRHPNIVQVQGIGAEGGDYFLVMEFLHGEDVRHLTRATAVQGRRLPLEHALSITGGVASALHYAHERVLLGGGAQQLIHRDVSPQNVIVTYDGGVKLVDFGIAKAATRLTETREGTLKGKIPYMSPEQCLERPLDRRSDVFSLAVMLWELLAGRALFVGPSEFEILKEIVERDAPPLRTVWPDCHDELERIVARGLARDREQRYPTAQALQADLEIFAREQRLPVSTIGLAQLMTDVFRDKLEHFHAAQAQGAAGLRRYVQGRRALNEKLATSSRSAQPADTVADSGVARAQKRRDDSLSAETSSPRTKPVAVAALPPRRRSTWVLAALGGVAIVCGGVFWKATRTVAHDRRPSVSPVAPSPVSTELQPPAAPPVASPPGSFVPPRVAPSPATTTNATHHERSHARTHAPSKSVTKEPVTAPAPKASAPVMLDP